MSITRDQVLDAMKILAQAQAEGLLKAPGSQFPSITGTPNSDAVRPSELVIDAAGEAKLTAGIDKARQDDETWKKVVSGIGSFLGGLLKGAVLVLLVSLTLGCSSTPDKRIPVVQAHLVEREALETFKRDHDATTEALFRDLHIAQEGQARLIEDYEIKLIEMASKSGMAPESIQKLKDMIAHVREERDKAEVNLQANQDKFKTADANFQLAMRIHGRIEEFLKRESVAPQDVENLMADVEGLKKQVKK